MENQPGNDIIEAQKTLDLLKAIEHTDLTEECHGYRACPSCWCNRPNHEDACSLAERITHLEAKIARWNTTNQAEGPKEPK